jgi:hypothetical protein
MSPELYCTSNAVSASKHGGMHLMGFRDVLLQQGVRV